MYDMIKEYLVEKIKYSQNNNTTLYAFIKIY